MFTIGITFLEPWHCIYSGSLRIRDNARISRFLQRFVPLSLVTLMRIICCFPTLGTNYRRTRSLSSLSRLLLSKLLFSLSFPLVRLVHCSLSKAEVVDRRLERWGVSFGTQIDNVLSYSFIHNSTLKQARRNHIIALFLPTSCCPECYRWRLRLLLVSARFSFCPELSSSSPSWNL